jgi:DNA-binding transcriptional LysR family regulator
LTVSNQLAQVSGLLRPSAPPSISDTLLAPLVSAFQASYPNVRVQILVTDRFVDHIAEGSGPIGVNPKRSEGRPDPVIGA